MSPGTEPEVQSGLGFRTGTYTNGVLSYTIQNMTPLKDDI